MVILQSAIIVLQFAILRQEDFLEGSGAAHGIAISDLRTLRSADGGGRVCGGRRDYQRVPKASGIRAISATTHAEAVGGSTHSAATWNLLLFPDVVEAEAE